MADLKDGAQGQFAQSLASVRRSSGWFVFHFRVSELFLEGLSREGMLQDFFMTGL